MMEKIQLNCTFYIVRHGETDWNVKQLIQGHSNSKLNKNGKIQAANLSYKLKKIRFDHVFSSDLLRAKQTAEIIVLDKKLAIATTKSLRERRFGKYEGMPYQSFHIIEQLIEKLSKEERNSSNTNLDLESDEQLISRVITFLREVAVASPGKTILIVTHGGVIRILLIHLGMKTHHGSIRNGAYLKLESDGIDFYIKEMDGIKLYE